MSRDIIGLSGPPGPELPQRQRVQRRGKGMRLAGQVTTPLVTGDPVIELTDSDDDPPIKDSSIVRESVRKNGLAPIAGPSQPRTRSRETQQPESTQHKRLPLFLQNDDEVNSPDHFMPDQLHSGSHPNPSDHVNKPVGEGPSVDETGSSADIDPVDQYLNRVLEIIPDVLPDHVLALVHQFLPEHCHNVVEAVIHGIFEDANYPKADKKGKRKRINDDTHRGIPKAKIDYANKDRPFAGGQHYADIALERLMIDFPLIPKPHIRKTLLNHNRLYAPTHLFLLEEEKKDTLPYTRKTIPFRKNGKSKALHDEEFDREREWLMTSLQEDKADVTQPMADDIENPEDGIECGCCFSIFRFEQMIQCPDAHLFCKTCMVSYASNLLGSHNPNVVCMDQSNCKLPFTYSELTRFLTPTLLELYERVKQRKEIEAAGLENLEECPFCDYKVVIENEEEKLFRCDNEECQAVTCRACKKLDHLPRSCKEAEEDKVLDGRHVVEEAMTRALMRNCPKCNHAFVKDFGCNKMSCPNCRTLSCYVCRKAINGYGHFKDTGPCKLWDQVEQRHADEVAAAARTAIQEYRAAHPDTDENAIKVDLPQAPPPPLQLPQQPMLGMMPNPMGIPLYPPAVRFHNHNPLPPQYNPVYPGMQPAFLNFNLNVHGPAPVQPVVHPIHPPIPPPRQQVGRRRRH